MRSLTLTARSKDRGRWATSRTPSRVLAVHYGVSPSRARHMRVDGDEPVSRTLALIADPAVDGSAIVAAALEALEDRFLLEARADAPTLRARVAHLIREVEHRVQAGQDRALMAGVGVADAALNHARVLVEIVAIRRALGQEEEV